MPSRVRLPGPERITHALDPLHDLTVEAARAAAFAGSCAQLAANRASWLAGAATGAAPDRVAEIDRDAHRTWHRLFGPGTPCFAHLDELYAHEVELFELPAGDPATTGAAHDVLVVDDFYPDPDEVRARALAAPFEPYNNRTDRTGGVYRAPRPWEPRPFWYSSALQIRDNPLKDRGVTFAPAEVRERLEGVIGSPIDQASWPTSGDGWNGAFHYKVRGSRPDASSMVHNHAGRPTDVVDGWSGVVFLSPDPPDPERTGTTIWRDRRTGRCWNPVSVYDPDPENYELAHCVHNVYNRLVLVRATVLHRGEEGFGHRPGDARLFQTFFFNRVIAATGHQMGPGDQAGQVDQERDASAPFS